MKSNVRPCHVNWAVNKIMIKQILLYLNKVSGSTISLMQGNESKVDVSFESIVKYLNI